MRFIKTLRLLLTFYTSYITVGWLITAVSARLFWLYGGAILFPVIWLKLITLALAYFFIRTYKSQEFYYYQNLGVSKALLWVSTLLFDLLLFILTLYIIQHLR